MAQLCQDYPEFVRRGAEVVVVSPEDRSAFAQYWRQEQFPFVGIPDPRHHIADHFGQQVKLLKLGRLPALVVIDKSSQIRYRHYGASMADIPSNTELLAILDQFG